MCGKGEVRVYDGMDDADNRPLPSLLTSTVCGSSPGVVTTTSRYLYVIFETEDDSNNFKLAWKAVSVSCCSSVTVSSTKSEVLGDPLQTQMLGK